jgi:hypothetical protein
MPISDLEIIESSVSDLDSESESGIVLILSGGVLSFYKLKQVKYIDSLPDSQKISSFKLFYKDLDLQLLANANKILYLYKYEIEESEDLPIFTLLLTITLNGSPSDYSMQSTLLLIQYTQDNYELIEITEEENHVGKSKEREEDRDNGEEKELSSIGDFTISRKIITLSSFSELNPHTPSLQHSPHSCNLLYVHDSNTFLITKANYSVYIDYLQTLQTHNDTHIINQTHNKLNQYYSRPTIGWSQCVRFIKNVQPYFVAFLTNANTTELSPSQNERLRSLNKAPIEIRNVFSPQIVQVFQGNFADVFCNQSVEYYDKHPRSRSVKERGRIREEMPSFYAINEDSLGRKQLVCFTQKSVKEQARQLVNLQMYSTALKICDLFLSKNFDSISDDEYLKLQKERAFYSFIIQKNYNLAKKQFATYKIPLEEIIILFADLYSKKHMEELISMFNINIHKIPFLKSLNYSDITEVEERKFEKVGKKVQESAEFISALKVFLPFFSKSQKKLWKEIKDQKKTAIFLEETQKTLKNISNTTTNKTHEKSAKFEKEETKSTSSLQTELRVKPEEEEKNVVKKERKEDVEEVGEMREIIEVRKSREKQTVINKLCTIFIFHSCILLLKERHLPSDYISYLQFEYDAIMKDPSLPVVYATELLQTNKLLTHVIQFLYHNHLYL